MMRSFAVVAILAVGALGDQDIDIAHMDAQEEATVESLPMYMYKRDCWKKRPISLAQEDMHKPGAGMDKVTPFQQVLKDGFYQVDCVRDYMFENGDKHGNNKFSYKLQDIANVSIVRYDDVVPKEDRDKMTHATCFAFCRTVPDMMFFGIRRGGTCYCAPYYKPYPGDSSMCDSVCEGEGSQMCGGESKSSIFEMHSCNNIASDLSNTASKMEDIQADMMKLVKKVKKAGNDMQDAGDTLYKAFNGMGDVSAARNIQKAKVRAGEILHSVDEAEALDGDMDDLKSDASGLKGSDFSMFAKAEEAEDTTRKMKKAISKASRLIDDMEDMYISAHAKPMLSNNNTDGAAGQYLPALYFVNKDDMKYSSTCGGKNIGEPLLGTIDDCAAACDSEFVGDCSGFSFMGSSKLNNAVGLCFVMAHFKDLTFYPKCGKGKSFLQTEGVPAWVDNTACMAKLSEFNGLSLKPDPSGKCKHCFKKVRKARDCFD